MNKWNSIILVLILLTTLSIGCFGDDEEEKTTVAIWNFNEGTGIKASDSTENGNDGSLRGGAAWVDGKSGKALEFNGIDSYVDAGDSDDLEFSESESFSVEAWVYPNTAKYGFILEKGGSDNNVRYVLYYAVDDEGKLFRFYRQKSDGHYLGRYGTNEMAHPERNWYHLVGVYDAPTDTAKLYVNGVLYDTDSNYLWGDGYTDCNFQIGRWNGGNYYFDGIIDEVYIYNYALSANEIQ